MKPGMINFVGPLLWQFDKAQESLLRIIFSMQTIIHRITNEANYVKMQISKYEKWNYNKICVSLLMDCIIT